MRKVTQQTAQAFLERRSLTVGNTSTDGDNLFLHGNKIASHGITGAVLVNFCGWPTPTTKERINGLCQLINGTRPFYTKNSTLMAHVPDADRDYEVDVHEWLRIERKTQTDYQLNK